VQPAVTQTVTTTPSHPPTTSRHSAPASPTPTGLPNGVTTVSSRLSSPSTLLLIAVVVATALGVAVVVRLGGRRGSHRV
jgi:hypothetical protein